MSIIFLETKVKAPIELVFDLSRNIGLHQVAVKKTRWQIVAHGSSKLLGLGDKVIWQARYFGVAKKFISLISDFYKPTYFVSEVKGAFFKSFRHERHFSYAKGTTVMSDVVRYVPSYGAIGLFVDFLFFEAYLKNFLRKRNLFVKQCAESGEEKVLSDF